MEQILLWDFFFSLYEYNNVIFVQGYKQCCYLGWVEVV